MTYIDDKQYLNYGKGSLLFLASSRRRLERQTTRRCSRPKTNSCLKYLPSIKRKEHFNKKGQLSKALDKPQVTGRKRWNFVK
jgi:hypothetical protein